MLKILAPSADQLKSTRGFLDHLAKVCEANQEHFISVSVHGIDFEDAPDYFIKGGELNTETNTAYTTAKSSSSPFNVTVFGK